MTEAWTQTKTPLKKLLELSLSLSLAEMVASFGLSGFLGGFDLIRKPLPTSYCSFGFLPLSFPAKFRAPNGVGRTERKRAPGAQCITPVMCFFW